MTIEVKHKFQSLKGDGSDLTQVQPSNWNDTHTLAQATGKVLGRVTAGAGPTEEIDWSAYGRQIINVADAAALRGLVGPVSNISDNIVTFAKLQNASAAAKLIGSNGNAALTITGTANNGSGLVRLTVTSTATFATGQTKKVAGVVGTTEANGLWTITVVDATHIDLQGSAFANNYVSGGTIGAGFEEIALGSGLSMAGNVLSAGAPKYLIVQETSNAGGVALINGSVKRLFNTVAKNEITGASIASNQFTLPAGEYEVEAEAYARGTGATANSPNYVLVLYDTTNAATLIVGVTVQSTYVLVGLSLGGSGQVIGYFWNNVGVITPLRGRFTLAAQAVLEIRTVGTAAGTGGDSQGLTPNVYGNVVFKKLP